MSGADRRDAASRLPLMTSRCPACGDVDIPPERMWLVEMSVASRSFYSFVCTTCDAVVHRPAGAQHRAVLRRWVPTEFWQVPAEALEPRPATPLTVDEVLDILLAMSDLEALALQWAAAGVALERQPT